MDQNRRRIASCVFGGIVSVVNRIVGTFSATGRGFGFVCTNNPNEKDIFISANDVNGALHLDVVECALKLPSKRGKGRYFPVKNSDNTRPEGFITRIISRGIPLLTGVFCTEKKGDYIAPMESKVPYIFPITTAIVKKMGLTDGHLVMFTVSIEGQIKVTDIFGHKNDPGMDILSLVRQFGVPYEFSEKTLEEASLLPQSVSEADMHDRIDYRKWTIITIDGSDTKDIDDAISFKRLHSGFFELGVHIADVSHYVQIDSPIDLEAYTRGTSIYLADRVIPMIPHKLSNGICSLNPNEDRLALSCIMEINNSGDVISHRIESTVIHSQRRFTYDEVLELLENRWDEPWSNYFAEMNKLAGILRKKRMDRGALDFGLSDAKIMVDDNGLPIDIELREANAATNIIEEFMIVCNETVAQRFKDENFVFRTHDEPDTDKIYQLSAYAHNLGYKLPINEKGTSAKALQKLLNDIQDTPAEASLGPVILRSLKQARYTMENTGHFGLASKYYCHFTSPIRRYPDLLVHRAVKGQLIGKKFKNKLPEICAHCSHAERNAESLEREVLQLKKVQLMADKIGQYFEGVVSSVVPWGFFVQLPNTIEGLVPLDSLTDDRYVYAEKQMAFYGVRKKKRIRLGDPVTVIVSQVNEEERKITFLLH